MIVDESYGMSHTHNRLRVNDSDVGSVGSVIDSVSEVYHQASLFGVGIGVAVNADSRGRRKLSQYVVVVQSYPVVSGSGLLRLVREE